LQGSDFRPLQNKVRRRKFPRPKVLAPGSRLA
jgi:hypothetical protein